MENLVELNGTVEKIVFHNEENGYSVFSMQCTKNETVTVTGSFSTLHQGSRVTVKGSWNTHPKFGRQFIAKECFTTLPASAAGIQKYLASGLIKGIGPKYAQRLVDCFGQETLNIIDQSPEKLLRIDGIGERRVAIISEAWQEQKEISRVMVFLQEKGVSPAYAAKIFKTYGNQAIDKVQQNPYRLVDDIWGIGFKTADQIALKMGLDRKSPERIKAGVLFSISQATDQGHLYQTIDQLKKTFESIIVFEEEDKENGIAPSYEKLLKPALNDLYLQKKIIVITHKETNYVALPQFYFSEKGIANKVRALVSKPTQLSQTLDIGVLYNQLRSEANGGINLNEDQQKGILCCLQHKITVITGGPGTGKTTLVKRLLSTLEEHRISFRLAAPTGRAAKRMFESTGRSTETLHRLLEFSPGTMGFTRNDSNTLELDFLIVDEASMIDVFLMNSLLKALPSHASLLLLGDIDQLPSVGAGNVLNDLIKSEKVPVIRLVHIFRQAQDSMIIVNAHRINHGEYPQAHLPTTRKDFVLIKEEEPENVFNWLKIWYQERLPKLGIKAESSIVLPPMNRGTVGTVILNQQLQTLLNPFTTDQGNISSFGRLFKINDRVMQIRNNYNKFVFNGDIGSIKNIDKESQELIVSYGDRDIIYEFSELGELVHSYAISIHKSQGSEFDAVIIPIFTQHFVLLQRNLLYTAITRAKKLCILIGQTKAIAMAVKNNKSIVRQTFLKEFLTTDLEARI